MSRRRLASNLCRQSQFESEPFRGWADRLGEPFHLYRKLWEWCYIAEALHERRMLEPGRRGLGFGVGREPLAALFASFGCEIVATDLDADRAGEAGWIASDQHASDLDALNDRLLCEPDAFGRLVSYRTVDMNAIPDDLRGFDFTWSSCSLEHLGSIEHGFRFLERQMDCLAAGGVAVHTTEFNLSSDAETLLDGPTVLFRRRDLLDFSHRLADLGFGIDLDLDPGDGLADRHIDAPPYSFNPHLKLRLAEFVTTSIGLIIESPTGSRAAGSIPSRASA